MRKNVVITGCSSGIGLAVAQDLHRRGYRVFATCRGSEDVAHMETLGYVGIQMDLDDEASVEQAAAEILSSCEGTLHGLVNNAGFGLYGPLHTVSRRQLEKQFSTNFFAVHQFTLRLLPALQRSGNGRIINMSSVLGLVPTPGRGAYSASKFALEAWSDCLRMELWQQGIYVSLIEPGPISSRFVANTQQAVAEQPVHNPPLAKRFTLTPEAVALPVRHALENRSPRRRYPVTVISHSFTLLKRLLPAWILDRLVRAV